MYLDYRLGATEVVPLGILQNICSANTQQIYRTVMQCDLSQEGKWY